MKTICCVLVASIALFTACGVETTVAAKSSAATQSAETAVAPPYSESDGVLTTYWAIQSVYNDSYCIEGGYTSGTEVTLADCPSGQYWLMRMQWDLQSVGDYYKIVNRYSGNCLKYTGTGSTNYYLESSESGTCSGDDYLFLLPSWPGSQNTSIKPKNASSYYSWPAIRADRVYNTSNSHTWHIYTQS